jgi:Mrp family chromosome partitioning ATPase
MPIRENFSLPQPVDSEDAPGRLRPATVSRLLWPLEGHLAAEMRSAVKRLYLLPGAAAPRVLLFTELETQRDDGQVCAHVADLLATSVPASVCLVDANVRSPFLNRMLRIPRREGLADLLKNPVLALRSVAAKQPDGEVWLLTAGAPSARSGELVYSSAMSDRITECRAEFDYTLIGASHRDALGLGRMVDGVVLILRVGSTRRDVACRVREEFDAAGVKIAGAILIDNAPNRP